MKVIKNDCYYLNRILKYINLIFEYSDNIRNKNSYLKPNDQESDGIIYKFIQLREETKHLSADLIRKNKELEYHINLLSGFRNRLTHDYDNVQYSFFIEIIENDLPKLKKILENILINL